MKFQGFCVDGSEGAAVEAVKGQLISRILKA